MRGENDWEDGTWEMIGRAEIARMKRNNILGLALLLCIVVLIFAFVPAHSASFYPACLKPDGDWLHGVTRKECIGKDVRGRWYTNRVLKKARRVM